MRREPLRGAPPPLPITPVNAKANMRALAMSIINKMTDAEIERLFFPQQHQPDISIREQCLATLRGCRKAQTVPMRYPIPARVAEALETMSLRAALDTHEAIVRMLKEIVAQEAK